MSRLDLLKTRLREVLENHPLKTVGIGWKKSRFGRFVYCGHELKGKGCFISTVVYGQDSAEVEALRFFRDYYLTHTRIGLLFAHTYYHFSRPLSEIVSRSPALKKFFRVFIHPVYLLAHRLQLAKVERERPKDGHEPTAEENQSKSFNAVYFIAVLLLSAGLVWYLDSPKLIPAVLLAEIYLFLKNLRTRW